MTGLPSYDSKLYPPSRETNSDCRCTPSTCCVTRAITAPAPKPAVPSWSTTAVPVQMSPSPLAYFSIATPWSFQWIRSVEVEWYQAVPFPSG